MMREVVDKFFCDRWCLALYSGMIIDVSEQWARFEAASLALTDNVELPNVEKMFSFNGNLIVRCNTDLRKYLAHGVLTEEFVLNNLNTLINCMRRCNVALRWRILHCQVTKPGNNLKEELRTSKSKEPKILISEVNTLSTMLLTSRFEEKLGSLVSTLIRSKSDIWNARQLEGVKNMTELSLYFMRDQALAEVERNEPLVNWFAGMAKEIELLSDVTEDHVTVTGRKIQLCIQALKDIEQFEMVDNNPQVKQTVKETQALLLEMVRVVSINNQVVQTMTDVADMSYAQEVIKSYVPIIHLSVNKDPSTVAFLGGLFLKLGSCLFPPTCRLEQVASPQLSTIKGYYSSFLIKLVKDVLEVIPVSVFSLLLQIADIKERSIRSVPIKIESESLKEYAQLDERFKLSVLTYELSVFTEGKFYPSRLKSLDTIIWLLP